MTRMTGIQDFRAFHRGIHIYCAPPEQRDRDPLDVLSSIIKCDAEGRLGGEEASLAGRSTAFGVEGQQVEIATTLQVTKGKILWRDLPSWKGKDGICPFFMMPSDILDKILGSTILTLVDHAALAATCRSLRACYWTPPSSHQKSILWSNLKFCLPPMFADGWDRDEKAKMEDEDYDEYSGAIRESREVMSIWSGRTIEPKDMTVLARLKPEAQVLNENGKRPVANLGQEKRKIIGRCTEWDVALILMKVQTISKTDAKQLYKVTNADLDMISPFEVAQENRAVLMYREVDVQRLAYALHGGFLAHEALLRQKAKAAAKAAATRRKKAEEARGYSEDEDEILKRQIAASNIIRRRFRQLMDSEALADRVVNFY